ncbi:MmyB family transcriptional regulator [Nocardia niigatensis]
MPIGQMGLRAEKKLLGQTMRQCRERAGISRDRLAPRAFITPSTLEKWENGDRIPTLHNLRFWFDALKVNDWYREKIVSLSQPALWLLEREREAGAGRATPTVEELRQLERLPFPASYRLLPTYDLIASNGAYRRLFPGLTPAPATAERPTNFIEWMLLSHGARDNVRDWRRHTHVAVNSLQVLHPGVVPQRRLDTLLNSCRRAPEFTDMWETDVSADDIHNPDMTVFDPTTGRWLSYKISTYRGNTTHAAWQLQMLIPTN